MNRADRSDPPSAHPRMLGRYRLLEELSENGVGVLHLARLEGPNGFQRWAAVRRVHPHLASDPVYVRDFYDAVRAAASIRHPNVEATLDVGETDGTLWVATEYLHGERSSHLVSRAEIAETGVAWDVACRIVGQAALGLDAIHASHLQRGEPIELTHGRLTPRQIFVSYEGETKVLEPCVPRRASSGISSDVLPYMAPEQVWGEPADRRADVFALGVVLWEMCAGRRLFLGDDDDATRALLDKHHVPRLETHVRGMPARVDEVIALALAEDPRHRYPTAADMAHAIDETLAGESLVVTDYDTGRYMKALFADRFTAREERLHRAADATEIFNRSSLPSSRPPPVSPARKEASPVSRRASIPPPVMPPKKRIPSAPETVRDVVDDGVHEAKTVEGISLDNYLESNENPTAILSEKERKALLAEANPEKATTDESETAIHRGVNPSLEFIDSTEIQAVPAPTPHLELADIMDDEEPAPEAFFRTGENQTDIGPAPAPAALPVPAAVARQGGQRRTTSSIPPPSSGMEAPPTVEINAT
ncbi:MAG TPA: serine/threonine-protein kinase, partial [Polyangiaceae bacterium]